MYDSVFKFGFFVIIFWTFSHESVLVRGVGEIWENNYEAVIMRESMLDKFCLEVNEFLSSIDSQKTCSVHIWGPPMMTQLKVELFGP